MAEFTEVAEGVWCADCEFFEDDDYISMGRCSSCGCPASTHQTAVVVVEYVES